MNIIYLGSFRFPKGDAAAARVLNNARILQELKHKVSILSFGGDKGDEWQYYEGIPYLVTSDMDTHSWKERFARYTKPYPKCRELIKQMVDDIDTIICYNLTYSFSKWLIPFCKKNKKNIIVDVTEWYSPQEMPGGRWTPIYWMSEFYMKHILNTIPNRILISNYLINHYPSGNNLLLPPLVNVRDAKWFPKDCLYPEEIVSHQGLRILYSGTPNNKDLLGKIISATLDLLLETKRIQIIIAGVNEEQGLMFFEKESDYLDNKQHFVFLGRIPQDMVPAYYQIADFSAIIREPTRKNMAGFPTKMAESMAAGCPVIASVFSDMTDYIEDGKNGIIVSDYSVEAIKEGMKRILTLSSNQINDMKLYAKRCGESRFDYRNYIDKVNSFIMKLSN